MAKRPQWRGRRALSSAVLGFNLSPEQREHREFLAHIRQPAATAARSEFIAAMLGDRVRPRVVHRAETEVSGRDAVDDPQREHPGPEATPVRALSTYIAGQDFYRAYPRKGSVLMASHDPENPYDSNAVSLWAGPVQAGHLPRGVAATVAPMMDAGFRVEVTCTRARGNSKLGAPIEVRVYEPSSGTRHG